MSPRILLPGVAGLALAACDASPERPPRAQPFADPGFVTAGAVRLNYALTLTGDLPSAIAGSYGILQRRNLALLAITLTPAGGVGASRFAAEELHAEAVTVSGARQRLSLRRVDERGGPTYLATVTVRHRDPITIVIRARASAGATEIAARWTREFHLD
jgi:hypothetical protein